MNLFEKKTWRMHSGAESNFKIECDSLTFFDWDTIAYLIAKYIPFSEVAGVPRGGLKLSRSLKEYRQGSGPLLIVDDVLTTGKSMERMKDVYLEQYENDIVGVVLFARGKCPDWITPIFQMNELLEGE